MLVCPPECTCVEVQDLAELQAPAVVVLGERHAHRGDLRMAARVIERLSTQAPVTVALEAVPGTQQEPLNLVARGELKPRGLKRATDWKHAWGHPFGPYLPVLKSPVPLVGAGLPIGPAPEDHELQIPEAYVERFQAMSEEHEVDVDRFARSMAWRDLRIAEQALSGWSGEGYLVILTGHGHVSGGHGLSWQMDRGLTEVAHHDLMLSTQTCEPGDRALR